MRNLVCRAVVCAWLFAPATASAIVAGQVDDFQGGTTMGWTEGPISPNPPVVIFGGGPDGAGDNYLRNTSSGGIGAGSRLVMLNRIQWAGNYLAAGVTRIDAHMANFGASTLSMRIAIEGTLGHRFASTSAVSLPPDGLWHEVTFHLTSADLSLVSGTSSLTTVLSNVTEFRILSAAAGPSWMGDAIVATLGTDNITARVTGDCDADGDVDLDDHAAFESCDDGPGGGLGADCGCVDLDLDGDVDLRDFASFQIAFTDP